MTFSDFWSWLENLPLAVHIAETIWFPILESLHVVAVTLMVGALLMVDLRLLGLAARRQSICRMTRELTPWAWGAFAVAALTGLGLFITRAAHYATNVAFQAKVLLLLLAAVNMSWFQLRVGRQMTRWESASTPTAAKTAGGVSLVVWCGVLLAGRWVGHLS